MTVLVELDTLALRRWGDIGLDQLGQAREEIDALNVFPVPDGDTGTNLFLTFEAGVQAASEYPREGDLAELTAAFATGALLGARGNSGVIVAQLLRGMAESFATSGGPVEGRQLAAAFTSAADLAYGAVARPVEGTVLTVARAAATAAESLTDTLAHAVSGAAAAARTALARTPSQLEALRRAGVVDAGGRGLVVLLDALESVVLGQSQTSSLATGRATWTRPDAADGMARAMHGADPDGPAFEIMYLLEARKGEIPALRNRLDAMGDSVVVVGGDDLWNVHVHADDPGSAVEAAVAIGRPFRIQITSLRRDSRDDDDQTPAPGATRGVVAVVPGQALADLFESVGATTLIGAAGRRPPIAALIEAIRSCQSREVVLLPNDSDHLAVADAAADEARRQGRRVAVVPTRALVQGLSALAVHDNQRRFNDDVVAMTSAAGATRHGAVTTAVRESMTSAGICYAGDALGLIDDDVAVIGSDVQTVANDVVDRMLSAGGELVTLVRGSEEIRNASAGMTSIVEGLRRHLRENRPDVEVVSYDGGQEHYCLLLGVE